jgi:succinate dehydrogenase / fumarate reductase flavoprotein subunit
MTYPTELRASLEKVVASRPHRLTETYPRLEPREREAILHTFHPDYITDAFREIRVGPNTGDRTPRELADILEAPSILEHECYALDDVLRQEPAARCDVLVVGGGGAGASAALLAQENGADVLLCTKLRFGDANTMMAQGGIQAADKVNDSPALHYLDVMGGGGFTSNPDLVEMM